MTDDRPAEIARNAARASVLVALFLLALKGYAAWTTGSVAMLGSLADSSLDVVASLVTLGGVSWAALPADEDHRFGHGKAEALAALTQTGLIVAAAAAILWRALGRMMEPAAPARPEFGIAVSLVAIGATLALLAYQRRAVRLTGSVAIRADQLHYRSDLGLNLAVIAALALEAGLGLRGADPVFGLAIALYLGMSAITAGREAVDILMDREWPEEERQRLMLVAAGQPQVRGLHELRTRRAGTHNFIQFHIWVDPAMSVAEAHEVVDAVEARVAAAFPGSEILIHVDPEGHRDRRPHHR